jgi:hypothetical protein
MDKPDVGPISGEPPAELLIEDIITGDGEEAKPGRYVSVHYVGVAFSSPSLPWSGPPRAPGSAGPSGSPIGVIGPP